MKAVFNCGGLKGAGAAAPNGTTKGLSPSLFPGVGWVGGREAHTEERSPPFRLELGNRS